MKKSDGIIRNTLSMMEGSWSDDDVITKATSGFLISVHNEQSQGGVKISVSGTGRTNNHVYLTNMVKCTFSPQVSRQRGRCILLAITGFTSALEPQLNRVVAKKYTDARNKPHTLEDVFQFIGSEFFNESTIEFE